MPLRQNPQSPHESDNGHQIHKCRQNELLSVPLIQQKQNEFRSSSSKNHLPYFTSALTALTTGRDNGVRTMAQVTTLFTVTIQP